MINNSEDTIIRYNSLSKKDQELKNKIFNNNNEKKKHVIIDKNNKKEKKNNFEQGFDAPSQKQIDDFLKNMEDNFNKITEKQVSIGMLNQHTQIMNKQAEILGKNQENLAKILENNKKNENNPKNSNNIDTKQIFQELLKPIRKELEEIQKSYQEIKELSHNFNNKSPKKAGNEQNFIDYKQKHSDFKQKLEKTQHNLEEIMPQNVQILSNLNKKTVENYVNCIENLKDKIEFLHEESIKAEKNLENLHKKSMRSTINQSQNINIPTQIDFKLSKETIISKLDGEYDYDRLFKYIDKKKNDFLSEISDYQSFINDNKLIIPPIPKDIPKQINQPSILDEIKSKYNIISKPNKINNNIPLKFTKKQNNKPKTILNIISQPKECPKDIKYEKKKENAFESLFDFNKNSEFQEKRQKKNETYHEKRENIIQKYDEPIMKKPQKNEQTFISKDNSPIRIPKTKNIAIQSEYKDEELNYFIENLVIPKDNKIIDSSSNIIPNFTKIQNQNNKPAKINNIQFNEPENQKIKTFNYNDLIENNINNDKKDISFSVNINEIPFNIGLNCLKENEENNYKEIGENILKEKIIEFAEKFDKENNIAKSIFDLESNNNDNEEKKENFIKNKKKQISEKKIDLEIKENIDNNNNDQEKIEKQSSLIVNNVLNLINNAISQINSAVEKNVKNLSEITFKKNEKNNINEDIFNNENLNENQNFNNPVFQFPFLNYQPENFHKLQPLLPINPADFFKEFSISESEKKSVSSSIFESIPRKNKKNNNIMSNSSKSEGQISGFDKSHENLIENKEKLLTENIFEDISNNSQEISEGEIKLTKIF